VGGRKEDEMPYKRHPKNAVGGTLNIYNIINYRDWVALLYLA